MSLLSLVTKGRTSSTQAPSSPTKATSAGTVMVSGGPSLRWMRRCMSILSGRARVSGKPGAVGTPDTGPGASLQHIDGVGHAVLSDLDAEIGHPRERVVPGVSLEARVAFE